MQCADIKAASIKKISFLPLQASNERLKRTEPVFTSLWTSATISSTISAGQLILQAEFRILLRITQNRIQYWVNYILRLTIQGYGVQLGSLLSYAVLYIQLLS